MADTNYFSGIVKILENPTQILVKEKFSVLQFHVEIPQIRNPKMITLTVWGNLANEVKNYYQINDYIIVEGYLSIQANGNRNSISKKANNITITVLKLYPFLLQSSRIIPKA